jgi:eukaryotic-like serine/threonine-protein kinase
VQQSGDRLRVNARLLRPDGSVAWAGETESNLSDLFALETRLADSIISGLSVKVSAAEQRTAIEPPTRNQRALEAYWQGLAFLDRTDASAVLSAIASFEQATALDPQFASAFGGLGESYRRQYAVTGQRIWVDRATAAISHGLAIDPRQADVRLALASLYGQIGRSSDAIGELRTIISQYPENDEAHRRLAVILSQTGMVDDALAEYRRAVSLRPQYWRPHEALGLFLYAQQRLPAAVAEFTRVVELHPDAVAYFRRGTALQSMGDRRRAHADYDRSIQIEPSAGVYSNLGALAFDEGRFSDAADAFSAAVRLRPNRALYHRNLGDAYKKLKRDADAHAEYLKAVALAQDGLRVNPTDATLLSQLSVYEAKIGDGAGAKRHSDEALARNSASPEVLFHRGVALALLGETPAAIQALEAAVAHGYNARQLLTEDDLATLAKVPAFRRLVQSTP